MLQPGDKAPSFAVIDDERRLVTLEELSGSKVLLWFYPAADTPG